MYFSVVVGIFIRVADVINQVSILYDEEEQHAVDEMNQFLVECLGIGFTIHYSLPKGFIAIALATNNGTAQYLHRFLNGIT